MSNNVDNNAKTLGKIGKFELLNEIGQGASSVVYEAWHPDFDGPVAIKLLKSNRAIDDDAVTRFLEEGKKLAALRHRHIVSIFDVNLEGRRPYLVMELLEGENLDHLVRHDQFSTEVICQIGIQLADALIATHANRMIHRDIKLSNIILTFSNGLPHATLMDFGIARNDETYTSESHFIGTFAFASPEQLSLKRVDLRSDIYSLGVVLYVLFTKKLPSEDNFQVQNTKHIGVCDLTTVPKYLSKIVDRCLEKNPQQRFQDAAELKLALEGALKKYRTGHRWLGRLTQQISRPVKQGLINAGVLLLALTLIGPVLLHNVNVYRVKRHLYDMQALVSMITAQVEIPLALEPERLPFILSKLRVSEKVTKLVVLDAGSHIQASLNPLDKIGAMYSLAPHWRAKKQEGVMTYFRPLPGFSSGYLGGVGDYLGGSLERLVETHYPISVLDKRLGSLVLLYAQDSGQEFGAGLLLYGGGSFMLSLLVFGLSYVSSRSLCRIIDSANQVSGRYHNSNPANSGDGLSALNKKRNADQSMLAKHFDFLERQ